MPIKNEQSPSGYLVTEVRTARDLAAFVDLPYRLYRSDPNFVPPLRSQIKDLASGKGNILFDAGPHVLLLCRKQGRVAGRIMAGVDLAYNQQNNIASAWISMFECEQDLDAAAALFKACEDWARSQGAEVLRGPESPESGDSFKGLLVMGFDGPPALMNSYNPPWYGDFFERMGFCKQLDLYAYTFDIAGIIKANNEQVIRYAMARYGYRVDKLDLKHLDRDLRDIHEILVTTIPTFSGEHMAIPSLPDVEKMARGMLPIADPDIICIARTMKDDRPIGLVVALPDYNQVFRQIRDGRLFPVGLIRFLYFRRKISAVRVFMQFVVPEYQRKAVNNAIFYQMCRNAAGKGYRTGDGSTIGETNVQSRASVERLGAVHYRTYRMYRKGIRNVF